MNTIFLGIRGVILTLLIFSAIALANLDAGLAAAQPHFAGLGRLGRDLVRRESAGLGYGGGLLLTPTRAEGESAV